MITVNFVCHGNICRSPVAEALFNYEVASANISSFVGAVSSATSSEEIGNGMYPSMQSLLEADNISSGRFHRARRINRADFDEAEFVVAMDDEVYSSLIARFGESDKIRMFAPYPIEDPWWTGNFERVYSEIKERVSYWINEAIKVSEIAGYKIDYFNRKY